MLMQDLGDPLPSTRFKIGKQQALVGGDADPGLEFGEDLPQGGLQLKAFLVDDAAVLDIEAIEEPAVTLLKPADTLSAVARTTIRRGSATPAVEAIIIFGK